MRPSAASRSLPSFTGPEPDSAPVRAAPVGAVIPRRQGAVAGVAAAAAAIGTGELIAGLLPGAPSPVIAMGALVIALQPPGAKDLVANLFGTDDKLALNVAVVLVALLIAAAVGIRARRSLTEASLVFAAFGGLMFLAADYALVAPLPLAILNAVSTAGAGILVLRVLLNTARAGLVLPRPDQHWQRRPKTTASSMPDWARRRFLIQSGSVIGLAALGGGLGRYLLDRQHPAGAPVSATLPPAGTAAAPLSSDEALSAPGITPIVMPNDRFYRIDTALLVPQVDASSWQLKVTGMVDHPLTFSYQDLLGMPLFEQYVTIACVSNKVGGNLVGNALWTGVHLKEVLAMAGVQPGATQIIGRSVDGFTVGFPTEWALAPNREPMIVVGMNHAPLPAEHGYPARLIVPGLYGYVSATKWLAEIQLTTREAADGYWIPLGWAKDGPILTQSRIDEPKDGDDVPVGRVEIVGVAWAPDRGISKVEVRIDGGPWQTALLSRAISKATWVQWMVPWQSTKGSHTIEVRATDGTGIVQTDQQSDPPPDGARGHHTIRVQAG